MRVLAVLLCLLAGPAAAWEFSPTPICTITHEEPDLAIRVTYDPARAEYAISLTRPGGRWPPGPVFGIDFSGPRPLTITTSRHRLLDGGRTLVVTDRGFDNVLAGLEFGAEATAFVGGSGIAFPLAGAAAPVQEFRACTAGVGA